MEEGWKWEGECGLAKGWVPFNTHTSSHLQLSVDRVKVPGLGYPEIYLHQRTRVAPLMQQPFWVLSQNRFDASFLMSTQKQLFMHAGSFFIAKPLELYVNDAQIKKGKKFPNNKFSLCFKSKEGKFNKSD